MGTDAEGLSRLSFAARPQGGERPAVVEARSFLPWRMCVSRALPERFGHWNTVWKRFDRLSKAGVFEAFFDTLASMSAWPISIQMFDSTVVRAPISAARERGRTVRLSGGPRVASRQKSTQKQMVRGP
jgi:transposase